MLGSVRRVAIVAILVLPFLQCVWARRTQAKSTTTASPTVTRTQAKSTTTASPTATRTQAKSTTTASPTGTTANKNMRPKGATPAPSAQPSSALATSKGQAKNKPSSTQAPVAPTPTSTVQPKPSRTGVLPLQNMTGVLPPVLSPSRATNNGTLAPSSNRTKVSKKTSTPRSSPPSDVPTGLYSSPPSDVPSQYPSSSPSLRQSPGPTTLPETSRPTQVTAKHTSLVTTRPITPVPSTLRISNSPSEQPIRRPTTFNQTEAQSPPTKVPTISVPLEVADLLPFGVLLAACCPVTTALTTPDGQDAGNSTTLKYNAVELQNTLRDYLEQGLEAIFPNLDMVILISNSNNQVSAFTESSHNRFTLVSTSSTEKFPWTVTYSGRAAFTKTVPDHSALIREQRLLLQNLAAIQHAIDNNPNIGSSASFVVATVDVFENAAGVPPSSSNQQTSSTGTGLRNNAVVIPVLVAGSVGIIFLFLFIRYVVMKKHRQTPPVSIPPTKQVDGVGAFPRISDESEISVYQSDRSEVSVHPSEASAHLSEHSEATLKVTRRAPSELLLI